MNEFNDWQGWDSARSISYWLGERLLDAALYPINLIRDFPVRFQRILALFIAGIIGILNFLGGLPANAGNAVWRRQQVGSAVAWQHRLIIAIFDLVGGPEFCQFFMRLVMPTSPLTPDEIGEMAAILGQNAIRWEETRIAQGGLLPFIFKYNGGRAFAAWHTIFLSKSGKFCRQNRALLAHELTHIYQYETIGTRYITEALYVQAKIGQACYRYGAADGLAEACRIQKRYADYNREAQAQIVQDYYDRQHAGKDVSAYQPFIAELQAGKF